jgi:pimeloyl-ACP methyl ester carboxylesterase
MVPQVELNIPTLYVMGEEDYMFCHVKVVENHYKSSKLFVIANCGHVVNVECFQCNGSFFYKHS